MADYSGQTLEGRYRISRLLGKGGMGSVYLGEHVVIHRPVAVKFLHTEFVGSKEVVKRFYREAQTAAAIRHKNIIDVLDVGVSDKGEPYLVMEYLEGESLFSMLERTGPVDLAAACGIMEPTLTALAVAHEKGIVHRDLKPDNIFLVPHEGAPPEIKLIDFGISKFTQSDNQTKLTRVGSLLGTPAYMSPEQARGELDVDHRTDLYAMGVIFYEMLTGELPFKGRNYNEILIKTSTEAPRPPREVYPEFPMEAEGVLMRSLSKEPDKRYQSTAEMLDALGSLKGFEQRQEMLTQFASGITKRSYAAGDLGDAVSDAGLDSDVAKEVLSEVVREATPGGWTRTTGSPKGGKQRRNLGLVGLALASLVVVGGIVVFALNMLSTEDNPAVVPLTATPPVSSTAEDGSTVSSEDQGVLINVEGAPEGARIFYDNSEVPKNPFRVKKGQIVIPLRVEAKGYEPSRLSLIPSKDQVLEVALKPVPVDKAAASVAPKKRGPRRASKRRARGKEKETPAAPAVKIVEQSKKKKKYVKGGRGTEIVKDFE